MLPKEGPGYTAADAKKRKFCFGIDFGYDLSY